MASLLQKECFLLQLKLQVNCEMLQVHGHVRIREPFTISGLNL